MRDGNPEPEFGLVYEFQVVSLPMRDGNFAACSVVGGASQLLAYL